jgi:hydrogenase maturation protein HypF
MAENHLDGKVIGVALDGTGYGTDGAIWGGEVLVADYAGFERAGHFEYLPLPGGAAAIHEPWRMAVSYLAKHYGKEVEKLGLPFLAEIDSRKLGVVLQMMEREINSPRTSSCGRLFDAVAALVGLRGTVNFEAQAAIELEMAARDSVCEAAYPLDLNLHGTTWEIGTKPLFDWLLKDIRQQTSVAEISRKFHSGLALVFVDVAERIRDRTELNRVCLSGGCFLNAVLLETMIAEMKERSFEVFFHTEVPAGDGGISLGQAVIAGRRVGSGTARKRKDNAETLRALRFRREEKAPASEGGRYKGLANLRLAVIPLDSVMVMVWPAGTAESLSSWPLGQRISRVSAWAFWARPKVRISSLAER